MAGIGWLNNWTDAVDGGNPVTITFPSPKTIDLLNDSGSRLVLGDAVGYGNLAASPGFSKKGCRATLCQRSDGRSVPHGESGGARISNE